MLRTGESLALHRGLCHGAPPVGSRLAVAVSYRAAWTLPEPDSHRLVDVRLRENNPVPSLPSFRGLSLSGHSRIQVNHESPLRGEEFVTRKIAISVARIKAGLQKELVLGNLEAQRDWGYAPEYVEAMFLMLQQDEPDDYVVATGEAHSVREFAEAAFAEAGLDWQDFVRSDPASMRPRDVHRLMGDPTKAREKLGWVASVRFRELVRIMVEAELRRVALLSEGPALPIAPTRADPPSGRASD